MQQNIPPTEASSNDVPHLGHPIQLFQDGSLRCLWCSPHVNHEIENIRVMQVITDLASRATHYVIQISEQCSGVAVEHWEFHQ